MIFQFKSISQTHLFVSNSIFVIYLHANNVCELKLKYMKNKYITINMYISIRLLI